MGLAAALLAAAAAAGEPPVLAGATMGTVYRVVLVEEFVGVSRGDVHREIELVLARIDRAASTWRADSEVSRFNAAAAGEWVEVGEDLARIIDIARRVHAETNGRFDATVGPLVTLWAGQGVPPPSAVAEARSRVGMHLVESRPAGQGHREAPPALRKLVAGVTLDLGGIGPGYAVDAVGERLVELGSKAHLVELGGEARAWGNPPGGGTWRLAVRNPADPSRDGFLELAAGEAVAFSTRSAGRTPIDPRTGLRVAAGRPCMARAGSCAEADARAVATAVSGAAAD